MIMGKRGTVTLCDDGDKKEERREGERERYVQC